jgi:squalene monooxygenase
MMENNVDIIVVGAGVAGGIFACSQMGKSLKVLVVERDLSEKDRIIGELMQPGGIASLNKMNLSHLLDGFNAQTVKGYTLVKNGEFFSIPYPDNEAQTTGLGLRNGKFLLNIQKQLAQQENVKLVEGNVTRLISESNRVVGIEYLDNKTNALIQAKAPLTVVCDGPMSLFREQMSEVKKIVNGFFVGMVLRDIEPIEESTGHIIVSGKSPVLVYPINVNEWRILVDFPGEKAPKMGEKMSQFLFDSIYPIIPAGMRKAFNRAVEEGDYKVMPNHNMKAKAFRKEGIVLLGDSLNMRHPLTGGGMTACFSDIIGLNKSLENVDFQNHIQVHEAVLNYYTNRGKGVETINILAYALYQVVKDKDLKEAVFNYLKKGGSHAKQPLSLLAGLNKDKQVLLRHFMKVAMQNPSDFIFSPVKQFRKINKAVSIMYPLLLDEQKSAFAK